ncbi:MAG: DNA replication/repair protein RecF [Bacteroidota bacterium]
MHLKKLSLINFKNYPEAEMSFSGDANAFVGNNGSGKTNLLDAIHYLSLCKSYFNPADNQNIRHAADFLLVQGTYELSGREELIHCGLKRNARKVFKRNNKEYERLADHIGLLPVVMISPVDSMLITEGSEERRKFIDSIISQYDKRYLDDLISYNKIVAHRNALLKQFAQSRSFDAASLEVWDEQLVPLADKLFVKRHEFISRFGPIFQQHYNYITDAKEDVSVLYESHLEEGNFTATLSAALEKDRMMQYTTKGIHKDDLVFSLGDYPVKRFASQGQQKSFLIALKLAQFQFIKEITGVKPILLLDDIFDKLDDSRVTRLMELVSKESFGQLFISDTHPERVQKIFHDIGIPIRVFEVENGAVKNDSVLSSHEPA